MRRHMLKQELGGWILQLLMAQDRAAAIVGDLEENGVSSMQFWRAIGSNILHALNMEVLIAAGKGCLAQFAFAVLLTPISTLGFFLLPFTVDRWVAALLILIAQILTAWWITSQKVRQPILIGLLVVIADGVLGLLRINNASINMSIWAIPLLISTVAINRSRQRRSIA